MGGDVAFELARRHPDLPQSWRSTRRSPGIPGEYLDMNHRGFARIEAVVGKHSWNFADFTTTSGIHAGRWKQEVSVSSFATASPRRPPTR
jgi:hypothetical protein